MAGLEISSIRKAGPTVQVLGFLPQRPVAFRREFERRRDVEILFIEDEIFEAEVLLTDGEFRNYMKARIVCDKGSQFVAVIAKEIAGGAVPTPTGTATPG